MTVESITDPLSYAAALLDAVGADREQGRAEIGPDCLYAADLLELAGARSRRTALIDGDPRASLRTALGALAALDEDGCTRSLLNNSACLPRLEGGSGEPSGSCRALPSLSMW
jgi:hypothetical protein